MKKVTQIGRFTVYEEIPKTKSKQIGRFTVYESDSPKNENLYYSTPAVKAVIPKLLYPKDTKYSEYYSPKSTPKTLSSLQSLQRQTSDPIPYENAVSHIGRFDVGLSEDLFEGVKEIKKQMPRKKKSEKKSKKSLKKNLKKNAKINKSKNKRNKRASISRKK